ncbi:MAG TPA: PEGA domain-containing protein [Pseudomonadota bacterium]|nr:PEGA domain-containing protein [Pseudomonadota bacterium]
MWRFPAFFAVLCLLQLFSVGSAVAQTELPALRGLVGDRKFSALLDQGQKALARNEPGPAIAALEDVYRYLPRPALLVLLGRAALLENRPRAAMDLYRRYIEQMGDEAETEVKAEFAQLVQQPLEVGADLTIVGIAGAFATVDGRLVGQLPLGTPVQLAKGKHQVVLTKDNRKVEGTVTLVPRRAAEMRFTLRPPLAVTTLTPGVLLHIEPPTIEPTLLTALRKSVSEAVGRQRAVLVSPDVQLAAMSKKRELAACLDQPSCQEKLALDVEARYVLRLTVQTGSQAVPGAEPQPDGAQKNVTAYRYTATVLDVDVGAMAASATDSCLGPQCTKLATRVGEMTAELLRTAESKPRGTIIVNSIPPAATVKLNDRTIGATPVRRDVFIGSYDMTLSLPGYLPTTLPVLIEDNREASITQQLAPIPVRKVSRALPILKWTTLAVGLAAVGGGVALLALDGKEATCGAGQLPPCVFSGKPGGAVLLSVGLLSLTGSALLFRWDR